jgi:hypothetical protein
MHMLVPPIFFHSPDQSNTTGALTNPVTDDVYIARQEGFTVGNTKFQKDQLAR